MEIGEIVYCLREKKNKISPGSAAVATVLIALSVPGPAPDNVLIQIGSLSAEL